MTKQHGGPKDRARDIQSKDVDEAANDRVAADSGLLNPQAKHPRRDNSAASVPDNGKPDAPKRS
jgi:hypothetical protein